MNGPESNDIVLQVKQLNKTYGTGCSFCASGNFTAKKNICPYCNSIIACSNINLELYRGEILGVVGESGSGKSTLVRCLYFDEEADSGTVQLFDYDGGEANILKLSAQRKRYIRNHLLGMVYQNPLLGIKPYFTAGGNVAEKLLTADVDVFAAIRERARELLGRTEVPLERMDDYPANFSGGMQQRVQIAKALANNPPLLFLDEITTGLDLSVQARVLDLIKEIQREMNISMLVVSHDFGVIRSLADRTIVMKSGRIIEKGLTDQILEDPQHEYTQLLVHSML